MSKNLLRKSRCAVWPGVLAVAIQWFAWIVLPKLVPEAKLYGMLGGILGGGLAVIVWWVFFSRAAWVERVGGVALIVVAMIATAPFLHKSIAGGAMGMLFPILAIPVLCLALVTWAVVARRFSIVPRRVSLVGTILLACAGFTLVRTGGMSGDGDSDLHFRWTPTPEEVLLSQAANEPVSTATTIRRLAPPATGSAGPQAAVVEWPGFRGPPATASSPACRSRPTGPSRRRWNCGGGRRTGLVILRRPRRSNLHAGAARQRRGRRLL